MELTDKISLARNVTQAPERFSYLGSSVFQFISTELEYEKVNSCGGLGKKIEF